jgi:hypothetical protein
LTGGLRHPANFISPLRGWLIGYSSRLFHHKIYFPVAISL